MMENSDLISINDFCRYNEVEVTFIQSLADSGLIEVIMQREDSFISPDQMPRIEKFIRMHYELDINVEGLETIDYLLNRIKSLQQEIRDLKNMPADEFWF